MAIHGNQPTNLQQTRFRNKILAAKINLKINANIQTKIKKPIQNNSTVAFAVFVVYYFSSDVELK